MIVKSILSFVSNCRHFLLRDKACDLFQMDSQTPAFREFLVLLWRKTLLLLDDNVILLLLRNRQQHFYVDFKWERQKSVVRKMDLGNLIFFSFSPACLPSTIETYFHELCDDAIGRRETVAVSLRRNNVICELGWEWHSRTKSWWLFIA